MPTDGANAVLPTFPPTRRVLWDRTPSGPALRVPCGAWAPALGLSAELQVELASVAAAVARRRSPEDLHLLLRGAKVSEKASYGRSSLLLVADCSSDPGEVTVPVMAVPETRPVEACLGASTGGVSHYASSGALWNEDGLREGGSASRRRQFHVSAAMAQRLLAQLRQRPGVDCTAEPSMPWLLYRWVGVLSSDPVQRKVRLRLTALYPQWSFYVTALARPLRTLETPLLQTLLMPEPATSMGFGLLTLDQGRCLLCLLQDEALAQEVPLVGVWVDQRHETHEDLQSPGGSPAAWAAAAHFVKRRQAREKVWVEKDTFLVMSVVQTRATPASSRSTQLLFSEFRFEDVPGEEGLYLASVDFDEDQAGRIPELMFLDTFTADHRELAKIAGGAVASPEVLLSPACEAETRSTQSEEADQDTGPLELRTGTAAAAAAEGSTPTHPTPLARPGEAEEPRRVLPRPAAEECRRCGTSFLGEAAFCSNCGLRRPAPSPPDVPPQTHLWTPGADLCTSPSKGRFSTPAVQPSTPSSRRSDASREDGISLRQIVGQQQQQLGLLQSQLQSVQQLLTHLVTKGSSPRLPDEPVIKADAAVHAAMDEVKAKVSVAHAQTSPRAVISTGLQASATMQDVAVNTVPPKPETRPKTEPVPSVPMPLPAMRDSADTAGGASPRCLPEAPAPTIRGQLEPSWNPQMVGVPRILCPSDLSLFGSDDDCGDGELSDGSIDLMSGDFTLEPVR